MTADRAFLQHRKTNSSRLDNIGGDVASEANVERAVAVDAGLHHLAPAVVERVARCLQKIRKPEQQQQQQHQP